MESLLHLLRDCDFARQIWLQLVSPQLLDIFFSLPLQAWLLWCLAEDRGGSEDGLWKTRFGVSVWWLWKRRNKLVFDAEEEEDEFLAPMQCINYQVRNVCSSLAYNKKVGGGGTSRSNAGWQPSSGEVVKVNTDGAVSQPDGSAAAGGLIRASNGAWLGGFAHHLGSCSVGMAELWGAFNGLSLAWDMGYRSVILELDSKEVCDVLEGQGSYVDMMDGSFLLAAVKELLERSWVVHISHIAREANMCADWLAKMAFATGVGFSILSEPPAGLASFLFSDLIGVTKG